MRDFYTVALLFVPFVWHSHVKRSADANILITCRWSASYQQDRPRADNGQPNVQICDCQIMAVASMFHTFAPPPPNLNPILLNPIILVLNLGTRDQFIGSKLEILLVEAGAYTHNT
jgi:hypothetical protein